ncbi:flagellin [Halomicrobium salinisoli]|uniref:flagellin n=1 Tax=Halomicrobium salinisoli TaxID=2878391 RepID=UPI001CF00B8A|nr:flagellin [Halomicrobium salinisoli]
MGFSVSGSAAIVFVGLFVAFGMFYTATANGFENVHEAQDDRTDRTIVAQNTAIDLTLAEYNSTAEELTVRANNTGATELTVGDVDLLADNRYLSAYATEVDGDPDTDLWLPQERLTINASLGTDPGRVKLVTGPGVAATERTEVVT